METYGGVFFFVPPVPSTTPRSACNVIKLWVKFVSFGLTWESDDYFYIGLAWEFYKSKL